MATVINRRPPGYVSLLDQVDALNREDAKKARKTPKVEAEPDVAPTAPVKRKTAVKNNAKPLRAKGGTTKRK